MMRYKNKKGVSLLVVLMFMLSSVSFATSKIEKLAEHDAFEFLVEVINGSTTTFKGKPMQLNLHRDQSNKLNLHTSKLVDDYKTVEESKFSLENIVAENTDYELDVVTNDDTLFALLTNNDDSVRNKKNILLKSTDGSNWELYKSFRAEWELFDLEIDANNLSVTCINCENELKLSYLVSNDSGASWSKYSLPDTADASYFSGLMHNKLFVVAQNRSAEDRKQLVNELMFSNVKTKNSGWVKSNTKELNTIVKEYNGENRTFKFNDVDALYSAGEYIVADVTYSTEATEDEESVDTRETWISKDDGLTWSFYKLSNLAEEKILQFDKKGAKYHLVTSKDVELPNLENTDSLDPIGMIMLYFKQQKYSYYTLSRDDMEKTGEFSLEPVASLDNGIGVNVDYKISPRANFVDAMFLHNADNDLKLEFYRISEE